MKIARVPSICGLAFRDDPPQWASLGFDVTDDRVVVGDVTIVLGDREGWQLDPRAHGIDGIEAVVIAPAAGRASASHPNALIAVDHVVLETPDWSRTINAMLAAGFAQRSTSTFQPAGRPPRSQAFFRVDGGARFVEVIGPAPGEEGEGPARVWGLTFTTSDLSTTARAMGDLLSRPRPAVQRGRQIATVARAAGLAVAIAVMTPRPDS
ncbi:MAG TPA: hypothetical protein VMY34_05975 [Acidimicrobiales bacterium]|nr:hypothetical protein [Acidimicrobiales bacterium]